MRGRDGERGTWTHVKTKNPDKDSIGTPKEGPSSKGPYPHYPKQYDASCKDPTRNRPSTFLNAQLRQKLAAHLSFPNWLSKSRQICSVMTSGVSEGFSKL